MSGSLKSNVSELPISQASTNEPSTSQPSTSQLCALQSSLTTEFAASELYAANLITNIDQFKNLMDYSKKVIRKIAKKAEDVFINSEMIKECAGKIWENVREHIMADDYKSYKITPERIKTHYYPDYEEHKLDLLFLSYALYFSLWNPPNTKQWIVNGQTGYAALCLAIKRAVQEGKSIWDPKYYSKINQTEVNIIFRSDDKETNIPFIEERVKTLHEIGNILLDKYQGTFVNCVKACQGDALQLRYLLYKEFERYRETVYYNGKEVYIGSKASALIIDLSYLKEISGDIYTISTIFIDCCAPRILLHMGIIGFNDRLNSKFANDDQPLKNASREELEIRCCSLWAARSLCSNITDFYKQCMTNMILRDKLKNETSIIIDNFLRIYRDLLNKNE